MNLSIVQGDITQFHTDAIVNAGQHLPTGRCRGWMVPSTVLPDRVSWPSAKR